jgi:hypothetical protein
MRLPFVLCLTALLFLAAIAQPASADTVVCRHEVKTTCVATSTDSGGDSCGGGFVYVFQSDGTGAHGYYVHNACYSGSGYDQSYIRGGSFGGPYDHYGGNVALQTGHHQGNEYCYAGVFVGDVQHEAACPYLVAVPVLFDSLP